MTVLTPANAFPNLAFPQHLSGQTKTVTSYTYPGAVWPKATGPAVLSYTNAFPNLAFPQHGGNPNYPGASFNPTSLITGSGGFYRADMGVTQSGGDVTSWADQSSFNQNLPNVNGMSGSTPTWSSSGFNSSYPGVTFVSGDGTSVASTSGYTFGGSAQASFFILLNQTSFNTAGSNDRILSLQVGSDDTTNPHFCTFYWTGSTDMLGTYSSGYQGAVGSSDNQHLPIRAGVPLLWGGVFDGTHFTHWINGRAQTPTRSSFSSTIGGSANQVLSLGGQSVADMNFDSCVMAFAGITQKAMTQQDWANLTTWCNLNWGTSFIGGDFTTSVQSFLYPGAVQPAGVIAFLRSRMLRGIGV